MSNITAQWDNPEKTIMLVTFARSYTWEDYHKTLLKLVELFDGIDHPVVMMNHYLPGVRLPKGSPYSHMNRTASKLPAALLTCIVTQDTLIKRMIEMSFRTSNARDKPHIFCETLGEAREQAHAALKERSL